MLKFHCVLILISFSIISCTGNAGNKIVTYNQDLVDELAQMVEVDQLAAANAFPPEKYEHLTQDKWNAFKDSVYKAHQIRALEILNKYGFVGYDLAGEGGSSNFWIIVQHSDHDPDFQLAVLEKMKHEIAKENADPRSYGYLVDRVNLNMQQPQLYGTQVDYNMDVCQAFPKNLADSINVNKRRAALGLKPLEEYLNEMSMLNFEMNQEFYAKKGVTQPTLYIVQ